MQRRRRRRRTLATYFSLAIAVAGVFHVAFSQGRIVLLLLNDVRLPGNNFNGMSSNNNSSNVTLSIVQYSDGVLKLISPNHEITALQIKPGTNEAYEKTNKSYKQQLQQHAQHEFTLLRINKYLKWHREQRSKINNETWANYNYLILRCLQQDKGTCGGASDRLVMTPYLVLRAYQTKRLLFIKWEQPALEEFLLPPKGGLDWRIPSILEEMMPFSQHPIIWIGELATLSPADSRLCVDMINPKLKFEEIPRGRQPETFDGIYRSIWDKIFVPTAPVQNLINMSMDQFGLTQGDYVAAHVRALFLEDQSNEPYEARNAVDCAAQLLPAKPIFFASDSRKVTGFAIEYGTVRVGRIVANINDSNPLHLDRGTNFFAPMDLISNRNASDFYSVFVDLFLLGNARCVTHGIGG